MRPDILADCNSAPDHTFESDGTNHSHRRAMAFLTASGLAWRVMGGSDESSCAGGSDTDCDSVARRRADGAGESCGDAGRPACSAALEGRDIGRS